MEKQGQMQEIYEGRIASLERFVAFLVMFHAMAKSVQDFWPRVSFGLLGYDMSRSQSIMRIATTASPVSGSDVRHKMLELSYPDPSPNPNPSPDPSPDSGPAFSELRLCSREAHG